MHDLNLIYNSRSPMGLWRCLKMLEFVLCVWEHHIQFPAPQALSNIVMYGQETNKYKSKKNKYSPHLKRTPKIPLKISTCEVSGRLIE